MCVQSRQTSSKCIPLQKYKELNAAASLFSAVNKNQRTCGNGQRFFFYSLLFIEDLFLKINIQCSVLDNFFLFNIVSGGSFRAIKYPPSINLRLMTKFCHSILRHTALEQTNLLQLTPLLNLHYFLFENFRHSKPFSTHH